MRIVVTAGHTIEPIDATYCISNLFRGRTGANIAAEAYRRGHHVHWLTSDRQTLDATAYEPQRWQCTEYATFAELHGVMEQAIALRPDVVIHSAAVSDYHVAEVVTPKNTDEWWLRLAPNPKLIDFVRSAWYFKGILVKFKLENRMDASELTTIAEAARTHSAADFVVANTLAGLTLFGPIAGRYERVRRRHLATKLLDAVEALAKERT